jgi:hypothetical protein
MSAIDIKFGMKLPNQLRINKDNFIKPIYS